MLSLYCERRKLQRRRKQEKLQKLQKLPRLQNLRQILRKSPRKISNLPSLPKLPPINVPTKKMYKPDIGRNALIDLCGYPPSTQNIDEMIANNHFIS